MKLRTDKLGGPTEEAAKLRDAYIEGVEQKLEDLLGPELESEDKEKEERRRMRRKTNRRRGGKAQDPGVRLAGSLQNSRQRGRAGGGQRASQVTRHAVDGSR